MTKITQFLQAIAKQKLMVGLAMIMIYPISLTVREKEIVGNSNAMSSIFA
jgi:hypothetical protein